MSQHGYPQRFSGRSKVLQEDGLCQPTIEVLVESLTGSAFQMTVSPHDTVYVIKTKIFRVEGIPMSQQHLLYNLKELEDSASLSDYSIKDGSTLKLVLSIRGGPISTRRLPLPSVDDIQWRDIRDLVENNRDEALEWLPPGCKVLVFRDGDNVNLVKVIEDDDDEHYTTLGDYSFSDETAVTMCKMIDLRCKMEKLSMKRNKKKQNSKSKVWLDRREKVAPTIKRTSSEENISSTLKGVFDETPNFTKYKYSKMFSSRASDDNISSYSSAFNMDAHCSRLSSKNDKFGLWQPIGSLSEAGNNESSSGRSWRTCTPNSFLREGTSPADYFKTKTDCNSSTESFKDSILAGTLNASYGNVGGKCDSVDMDAFRDPCTSKEDYLGEATDLLDTDVIEQSNKTKRNSKVVAANVDGAGPGGVVLETASAPAPALPLPLLAHSPNTGGNYGEYRVAQLLSNDRSSVKPDQYDNHPQYYYHQPSTSSHLKHVVRKVVFGSNSHLNNIGEVRNRKDLLGASVEPIPGPSHSPSLLGSEPQLDQLKDPTEERTPKKNAALSNSISNLFFNSQSNTKLNSPSVDRTWSSELDKSDNIKYKRVSGTKTGSMVFSSSTSDLLGLKRNKILPSLSRHPNCERLDVSDESLHKINILKQENLDFPAEAELSYNDISFGLNGTKSNSDAAFVSPPVAWSDPIFTDKAYQGIGPSTSAYGGSMRRTEETSHFGLDKLNKSSSIHNIRFIRNDDVSEELNNSSVSSPFHFGTSNISRRNLEVGSERRCRRIKKIPKLDHNNLQDHKNRLDGVSRRHFLLGYGNQGYEASIQKMPNSSLRLRDKPDLRGYSEDEPFTPLYERVRRNQEFIPSARPVQTLREQNEFHSKLLIGLEKLHCSIKNLDAKNISTKFSDTKNAPDTVILPFIPLKSETDAKEAEIKKPKRIRCAFCKKRLSIASIHTCRCGVVFCAPHRYAEVHGCQYDYKAEGQEYLRRANPLVSAPKLPKI